MKWWLDKSTIIMLFPSWLFALTSLSMGFCGATEWLSLAQTPCCWLALCMSSPAHLQCTQHVNMSTNPASHQIQVGLARAVPASYQESLVITIQLVKNRSLTELLKLRSALRVNFRRWVSKLKGFNGSAMMLEQYLN